MTRFYSEYCALVAIQQENVGGVERENGERWRGRKRGFFILGRLWHRKNATEDIVWHDVSDYKKLGELVEML